MQKNIVITVFDTACIKGLLMPLNIPLKFFFDDIFFNIEKEACKIKTDSKAQEADQGKKY